MSCGPNVQKLLSKFIARNAVPSGGGLADGLKFFTDPDHRRKVLQKSEEELLLAIKLIKMAPDNTFGTDDETIAGEILHRIDEKEHKNV